MKGWLSELLNVLLNRTPSDDERTEATLRHIQPGPGEIAFEKALADNWRQRETARSLQASYRKLQAFNAAGSVEAKTALVLQWEQAVWPTTKKVEIEGLNYPPGAFKGLRHSGFYSEMIISPDGTISHLNYRTYC